MHVNVRIPRRLSDEQRRLVEQLDDAVGPEAYEQDGSLLGRIRAAFR